MADYDYIVIAITGRDSCSALLALGRFPLYLLINLSLSY
jgi:hypothetical protein